MKGEGERGEGGEGGRGMVDYGDKAGLAVMSIAMNQRKMCRVMRAMSFLGRDVVH